MRCCLLKKFSSGAEQRIAEFGNSFWHLLWETTLASVNLLELTQRCLWATPGPVFTSSLEMWGRYLSIFISGKELEGPAGAQHPWSCAQACACLKRQRAALLPTAFTTAMVLTTL